MTITTYNTDQYELTARQAASSVNNQNAVFEVYTRSLPQGRGYGVVAGMARLMKALDDFQYSTDFLNSMVINGVITADEASLYVGKRFIGKVTALQDGDLYFPNTPILTIEGKYGDILVVETLVLSILNHACAVASAGARMRVEAGDTPLIEAGARRTHEQASVAASTAAYQVGFNVSSNLAAIANGVPTAGTVMHAYVLAYETEREAFDAQIATYGTETSFLVDTYDTPTGIQTAIEACAAAGGTPKAIRIDSGDLADEAFAARKQLDAAGCYATQIVLSGDLDEYSIAEIKKKNTPVDVLQVGTALVTGSGFPAVGFVYKLVAIERPKGWVSVEKKSVNKKSHGGHKQVLDSATVLFQPEPFGSPNDDIRLVQFGDYGDGTYGSFVTEDREHLILAYKRMVKNIERLPSTAKGNEAMPPTVTFTVTEKEKA